MFSWLILIYPFYHTLQSIRKPKNSEVTHWLIFWFMFSCLEICSVIYSWFPLSGLLGSMFLLGLYSERVSLWFRKYFMVPVFRDLRKLCENSTLINNLQQKITQLIEKVTSQNNSENNSGFIQKAKLIMRFFNTQ